MIETVQRPIAKSGTALLVSQLALLVLNLFLTAYVVRVLSKEELATTALVEILYFLFLLAEMGLMAVATQQAPSELVTSLDHSRAIGLVKAALYYPMILVLLMSALAFVFSVQVSELFLKTPDYSWAIRLLVPGSVGLYLYYAMQAVAQIKQDYYLIARWNFLSGIMRHIFSIPGYWLFGFPGFIVGVTISCLIPAIGLSWPLRGFFLNRVPIARFQPTFRYGIPLYFRNILRFGYTYLDQILVGIFLTPSALASYNVAHRLRKNVHIAIESFQMPMALRMVALRQDPQETQDAFLNKSIRYTDLMIVPVVVLAAAASPWLMSVFGGPKYAADWPLLAILILGQAGYALFNVYSAAVFARLAPWATLTVDGLNGGINYLLIPALMVGIQQYGVALGQLIGFLAGIAMGRYLLSHLSGYKPNWSSLRLIAIPLILASSIIIVGQVLFFTWWSVPIYLLVAGILFTWMFSRRLAEEDWSQIRTFIPGALLPAWQKIERLLHRPVAGEVVQ
jgi:O-antigen/teichoic acid export membrane protein